MHSPVNEEKFLEFRIMPYASDQAMLVVRDVTQLAQPGEDPQALRLQRLPRVAYPAHRAQGIFGNDGGDDRRAAAASHVEPRPIKVMMEQTIRMDNLVNQLLTLSRIEAAPTVDLSHLVDMPAMLGLLEQEARALSGDRAHQNRIYGATQPVCARRSGATAQCRLQSGLQRHPLHPGGAQDHRGVAQAGGHGDCLP